MSARADVYDLVGVGIGPFNLALAALADAVPGTSAMFFDGKPEFSWHPGMLIEGTTLQVPFLADLVTLIDPTSRWSLLSYLRAHDRLVPFYFAERFHVPRREYDHYCRWVAQALPSCRFGTRVQAVRFDPADEVFVVHTEAGPGSRGEVVRARNVVLGVGTEPVVPEPLRPLVGKEVFHSAGYLDAVESLYGAEDITVIGSGQSGAEVFADLLRRQAEAGWRLRWLTRSPAFAPMEYSKLGLEHFSPDYTRYFHRLAPAVRDELVPAQWQLYKAISAETIAEIHDLLYERGIGGAQPDVTITPNVEVTAAAQLASGLELSCTHTQQRREFTVQTDRAVLATGYAPRRPDCLQPLTGLLDLDAHGRYRVDERYRVALEPTVPAGLYVQNAEAHTHGVGAPDLGLGAYRAAVILNSIVGRPVYPLPVRTAYTTFSAPETGTAQNRPFRQPRPVVRAPTSSEVTTMSISLSVPAELTASAWRRAGRELMAKMLAELSYEQLLHPVQGRDDNYRVDVGGEVSYTFQARRGAFDAWRVEPSSVRRHSPQAPQVEGTDPMQFLLDAHQMLGLSGDTAGHLARELCATLSADARLLAEPRTAAELAELPYAELEGHQTGHPWLIPNKGRMGLSASDTARYVPEARRALRLPWMAVHHSLARYRGVDGLDADRLLAEELDGPSRQRFESELRQRVANPAEYHWLPVHPWQWDEVVVPVFAAEVAAGWIVPLGDGPDRYLAQQSIRTFSNIDTPTRRHVKLPLSILNTLVWRGLPTERTLAAPAVTSWILGLAAQDAFLRDETRVVLLGEVASVTVNHPVLERIPGAPYQYLELLGAIWREPVTGKLDPGERARTLACLLQIDSEGRPLVTELVARSGRSPQEWLRRLFGALLPPLLHFLYRYGVVFSPHGENTIVVFDADDVPARLAVKDFVDDVNISDAGLPELQSMPPEVAEVLLTEPPEMLCQFIQSGLFVGHFRYLGDLFDTYLGISEREFWALARDEILAYHKRFPELTERFALFDLLAPDLQRLCLNRNRLLLDGYRDRPERPHAAVHGRVPNPLHEH